MEIRQWMAEGLSISEMARRSGHDRKTIRAALQREGRPLPRRQRGGVPKFEKLAPYQAHLDQRMAAGVWNAAVLCEEIRAQGYAGGITVVRQYVHPRRPHTAPAVTVRFETAPGEQAQVDFVDIPVMSATGRRSWIHVLLYALGYSRLLYAECFPGETRVHLLRGLDHAFRVTGGVPHQVLSDNLRAAILGRDEHGRPIFAPDYLAFAEAYGFTPKAARPYRPQTKGKVERPAHYLQHNFLPRITDRLVHPDFPALNRLLWAWLDQVANVRLHGTTHARPLDRWQREEVAHLQPVPTTPWGLDEVASRRVDREGYIVWKRSRYAVAHELVGRDVLVRETPEGTLCMVFGDREVQRYSVAVEPDSVRGDLGRPPVATLGAGTAPALRLAAAPPVDTWPLGFYERVAEEASAHG